jgi:hypothetical protein
VLTKKFGGMANIKHYCLKKNFLSLVFLLLNTVLRFSYLKFFSAFWLAISVPERRKLQTFSKWVYSLFVPIIIYARYLSEWGKNFNRNEKFHFFSFPK